MFARLNVELIPTNAVNGPLPVSETGASCTSTSPAQIVTACDAAGAAVSVIVTVNGIDPSSLVPMVCMTENVRPLGFAPVAVIVGAVPTSVDVAVKLAATAAGSASVKVAISTAAGWSGPSVITGEAACEVSLASFTVAVVIAASMLPSPSVIVTMIVCGVPIAEVGRCASLSP